MKASHDEALIAAWNAAVGAAMRARLNGRICLVLGNRDRSATAMRKLGIDRVVNDGIIDDGRGLYYVIHGPAKTRPKRMPAGALVLHGHQRCVQPTPEHLPECVRRKTYDCS